MAARGGAPSNQPHIYGASPFTWRQGTAVANADTPPSWTPEMAYNSQYPYTIEEWRLDVERWMVATRVSDDRKGVLLSLAVGGAARKAIETIPVPLLQHGAIHDLQDGQGAVQRSGAEMLVWVLQNKFPVNREAEMLRAGLEFFSFTPLASETRELLFIRFNNQLDRANSLAQLGISFQFRAWMLLSLLRLAPKQWSEFLKDLGHRLPSNEVEYQFLQQRITREQVLEMSVSTLKRVESAGQGTYMTEEGAFCQPLYMCLGSPAGHGQGTGTFAGRW